MPTSRPACSRSWGARSSYPVSSDQQPTTDRRGGTHDCDRAALHRLRRAHPRAPHGDARLRARGVPRSHLAHRDRRSRRGVAPLRRHRHSRELHGRGGNRRVERRRARQVVPRRAPLHRGPARGLQRQGPPPRHGPRRHRPRGAVPHDAARSPELQGRRLRRGAGARVQRLVLRPHAGRRGPAVRRRRGAADARARRRRARRRRDPSRRRAARNGVGVHAAEPVSRLAAVQRPGLRPDLAGGARHRPPDRAAPVPRARPARRVRRPSPRAARGTTTAATSTTSTRTTPPARGGESAIRARARACCSRRRSRTRST